MTKDKEQEIIAEEEGGEEAVDKLKKVKDQLKQCQKEKHDYLTGWQREKADFINYKRRQEEQMVEWSKMLGEGLVRDILPVLDALNASTAITSPPASPDASRGGQPSPSKGEGETHPNSSFIKEGEEGLKMVREQLMKALQKHGLEEMKSLGEKFNPELHEAVEQVEGDGEAGVITEEVQKGYLLNGKVVRVAKVKVSK